MLSVSEVQLNVIRSFQEFHFCPTAGLEVSGYFKLASSNFYEKEAVKDRKMNRSPSGPNVLAVAVSKTDVTPEWEWARVSGAVIRKHWLDCPLHPWHHC